MCMQAVAIVGDHNSGKTYLGVQIVKRLKELGFVPVVYKHAPHTRQFADSNKDTERYLELSDTVVAAGDGVFVTYVKGVIPVYKLFSLVRNVKADFLIYEGTPHGLLIPWIKVGSGKGDSQYTLWHIEDPFKLTETEINSLVDDVVRRSWVMPMMLNCGKCGVDTCKEYVDDILSGSTRECVLWKSKLRIVVDGKEVPLVPFIENLYDSVIRSLIKNLKGVGDTFSSVEIYLGREDNED